MELRRSNEQRYERAEAALAKAQRRLEGAEREYHKVNAGGGVSGVWAALNGQQKQRRERAADIVDSACSQLRLVTDKRDRARARLGLPVVGGDNEDALCPHPSRRYGPQSRMEAPPGPCRSGRDRTSTKLSPPAGPDPSPISTVASACQVV